MEGAKIGALLPMLMATLFWGGVTVLVFFGIKKSKPTYSVQITTASGETNALKDKDPEKIQLVINALNEAMIDRG
jgi:arginine exporter protein ArgO